MNNYNTGGFFSNFFSISFTEMLKLSFSVSQKITLPPALVIADPVENQVCEVVMTSFLIFDLKPKLFTDASKASVPFPQVTQYLDSIFFLKLFSNFFTSSPPMNELLEIIFKIALSISFLRFVL